MNAREKEIRDRAEYMTAFLREAARYFSNRPTGGEDKAHWSNVLNAENSNKAADLIDTLVLESSLARSAERKRTIDACAKIADERARKADGLYHSFGTHPMYGDARRHHARDEATSKEIAQAIRSLPISE